MVPDNPKKLSFLCVERLNDPTRAFKFNLPFLIFWVIFSLGILLFLFYLIFGFVRMALYPLVLGLHVKFLSFFQRSIQGILSVLEAPCTWPQSVYQTRRPKQWAVGLPRLGASMYVRILLFCLLMYHLRLFLIFLISMLPSSFLLP